MSLLRTSALAETLNISRQSAHNMLSNAAKGKPWRGHHLPVVQLPGQRGGAGGKTWGLDLTRATPELLDAVPGLKAHLSAVPATVGTGNRPEIDPNRVRVQAERFEMIKPAIHTEPGSPERGRILKEIAAKAKPCWGISTPPHPKTIGRWLTAYYKHGLSGLLPKANASAGQARVLLSRAWDAGIDLDQDTKEAIAEDLDHYTQSLIAKATSGRRALKLAEKKLIELCRDAGSDLSALHLKQVCKLTQKYTGRFTQYRRVARHDLDNKAFFDKDRPRITRGRCEWPMDVVYGDVHPIDIYMAVPEGKGQRRLRLIAWMDDCTRYMWATVAVLGKGQGIRQTDIADAMFNLVCDPMGGVPHTGYLDNGSEYGSLMDALAEIPGADHALFEFGGVVKAMPYNGPAKGLLEHGFSTLEQGYFKHIPGWIGEDRTNKKTHAVGKPVKGFEGSVEELVQAVLDMVRAYNEEPQGGLLNGMSPRDAMEDAFARGWQSRTMDVDAFDFAFSRKEERQINQGKVRFANQFWVSDATCQLGAGDTVTLRIPLRSKAEGIFVMQGRNRLQGRAVPETLYHPLDRDGARESARRNKLQEEAIRALKRGVDRNVDPAAEILKGITRAPVSVEHDAIIRLGDAPPSHPGLEDIEKRRSEMHDFAEYFRSIGTPEKRRTEGT